jgi:hypothetical protein
MASCMPPSPWWVHQHSPLRYSIFCRKMACHTKQKFHTDRKLRSKKSCYKLWILQGIFLTAPEPFS